MTNPTIETGSNAPPISPKAKMDAILAELPTSGLSTAALARKHGLAPWRLYNAQEQRRGGRKKRKRSELVPVKISTPKVCKTESFELVLASGHRLLVPTNFDEGGLRRLIGVLAVC